MAAIKSVTVKCGHCGTLSPSAIFMGDTQTFESATTWGNTQQCPSCGKVFNCNKENMSYTLADGSGGSMGGDFTGNKA